MLLFIGKLLPIFLFPTGISLMLMAAGAVCLVLKYSRTALGLVAGAFGVLWVFSLPVTAHVLTRPLESRYECRETFPPCSTIVLLCGAEVAPLPPRKYAEINQAGDRLMHAARLYHRGYAPRILITGGIIRFLHETPHSQAAYAASLIRELMGVDTSALILEPWARDTHDHGPLVAAILDSLGLPREIILVTSASHMPRSVGVFRKQGFTVHPAPTDYIVDERFQWKLFNFLPRASTLHAVTRAFHEYYGLLAYRILGWI